MFFTDTMIDNEVSAVQLFLNVNTGMLTKTEMANFCYCKSNFNFSLTSTLMENLI